MELGKLSDGELADLLAEVLAEKDRRRASPAIEEARAEVVESLRASGAIKGPLCADAPPESVDGISGVPRWVDPGTDHARMYLFGDVVSHNGKVWRSEVHGLNHWEPGAEGVYGNVWWDCTPTADEEADSNAWSAGVAYTPGVTVTYQGNTYEVLNAHTSADYWLPDVSPSLYRRVE